MLWESRERHSHLKLTHRLTSVSKTPSLAVRSVPISYMSISDNLSRLGRPSQYPTCWTWHRYWSRCKRLVCSPSHRKTEASGDRIETYRGDGRWDSRRDGLSTISRTEATRHEWEHEYSCEMVCVWDYGHAGSIGSVAGCLFEGVLQVCYVKVRVLVFDCSRLLGPSILFRSSYDIWIGGISMCTMGFSTAMELFVLLAAVEKV
jgi:hypothetical protein